MNRDAIIHVLNDITSQFPAGGIRTDYGDAGNRFIWRFTTHQAAERFAGQIYAQLVGRGIFHSGEVQFGFEGDNQEWLTFPLPPA